MFARVAKAWHLVLATQLAFKLEPIVKQILSCLYYLQVLQGYILIALSLVVTVYLLQMLVEQVAEELQILRTLLELDEPLMAALCVLVHKYRCSSIFAYLSSCLFASVC